MEGVGRVGTGALARPSRAQLGSCRRVMETSCRSTAIASQGQSTAIARCTSQQIISQIKVTSARADRMAKSGRISVQVQTVQVEAHLAGVVVQFEGTHSLGG